MDWDDDSFRDHLATIDKKGKRKWIYAIKPNGRFYTIRTLLSLVYFILFFGIPFIYIDGNPFFMINVPDGKYIIFGKIFWSQDFFIFGLAMVIFIVLIALFTAVYGRFFCGWICPQTVFMEMLFRKIEYITEGSAQKQVQLNQGNWSVEKIFRKVTKHILFYLLSFIIANFFLAYIVGIKEVWKIISDPITDHWVGFFATHIFSFIFYGVFAFFREQVCTAVCPYGRLQSVLIDSNSMIVAYDYHRGEPRGKVGETKGDCIDCSLCVRVCPTGIDIRNGLQMECVGCTACMDACDSIMRKIQRPAGLIRYASENSIEKGVPFKLTNRLKLYSLLIVLLGTALLAFIMSRSEIDVNILRAQGLLYQESGRDSISNLYTIRLLNKTNKDVNLVINLSSGLKGRIELAGARNSVLVHAEDQTNVSFFIILPRNIIKVRKTRIKLEILNGKSLVKSVSTNFFGPAKP